jgi:tetratricopeptide (TPR) repeat protein
MDYAGATKKKMEGSLSRKEIEAKLAVSGDYVKMDYLQSCLKKNIDFDTKRFVMVKLSSIYESRLMFLEAGKLVRNVADINTTFEGKYNDFSKSMELFVKGGNFEEADNSFKKALACGNERQKLALKIKLKDLLKEKAKFALAKDKRKNAAEAYEKLLTLSFLDPIERKETQNALLGLYQKLGKIREFYALQKGTTNPTPMKESKPMIEPVKEDDFELEDLFK